MTIIAVHMPYTALSSYSPDDLKSQEWRDFCVEISKDDFSSQYSPSLLQYHVHLPSEEWVTIYRLKYPNLNITLIEGFTNEVCE